MTPHLLGIRHHGPGSATAVLKALEARPPDCLLVEIPADGMDNTTLWTLAGTDNDTLRPPVAMLIYDPKDLCRAIYLPFADFSPEWVAVRFAAERSIPVRFMDLPMELGFALDEMEKENPQAALDLFEKQPADELRFRHDPLAYMASLAGYADSERWWEVTFENPDHETDVFAAILDMMTALREDAEESPRNLIREAYMRQAIRQAVKDGFQHIAVVCGAWHVPALHDFEKIKASHDAALLKGIKKIKTAATWIPWSYDRLTFQSGYRSGIVSPAWYEMLFHQKKEAATRWMIHVARLFREEDLDTSSAHVIEAIRLSEALAAMRRLAVPGIDELKEAAITTLCEGSSEKLELIENKLIAGNKVGSVPDTIPVVPLQRDIEQCVKSARLTKYWENTDEEWLGATAASPQGGIDLREESGKLKSHLLHRLNLLGIPWGRHVELNRHQSAGSFREFWKMKWAPEFAIQIIEMGAWGNTVEEACIRFLSKKAGETAELPALTQLVLHALDAGLAGAFGQLLLKLENLAALATDVYHLMDALPPLARIVRYGDTRGTDTGTVGQVVQHLVPRICIGLPAAVVNLDEEASKAAYEKLLTTHRALALLNDPAYLDSWYATLLHIAGNGQVNNLLRGACTRILFDKKIIAEAETANRMRFALSRSVPPLAAAQWLEGFLEGSGLLLLHSRPLWDLLDGWVDELGEEAFNDVLPMLRRTFSRFPAPERERMLDLARQGQQAQSTLMETAAWDEQRAGRILPTVKLLLGIGG